MKTFLIFLTLCIATVWSKPNDSIHKQVSVKDADSRIINGEYAAPGQFPWHAVVLSRIGANTKLCGGALITPKWVITAGTCVDGAIYFQIQLGSNTLLDIDEYRVTVTSTTYRRYASPGYTHNLALINIPTVTLSTYIQTIPIWPTTVAPDQQISITGFGATSDSCQTRSNQLKFVTLKTITGAECISHYGNVILDHYHFCAIGTGTKNICKEDDGGVATVTVDGTTSMVAIASFMSSAGCEAGNPSGFERALSYLAWITSITGPL